MKKESVKIYTDGSCHTQKKVGTWAAIVIIDEKRTIIDGSENLTTHQRMELKAILKSLELVHRQHLQDRTIEIFTDSQYAFNLQKRKENLIRKGFHTKKGNVIRNFDLVEALLKEDEQLILKFHKLKAHQVDGDKLNKEVDILVRNNLRKLVKA